MLQALTGALHAASYLAHMGAQSMTWRVSMAWSMAMTVRPASIDS